MLIFVTLLVPLVGGAIIPLLHLDDKRRGIYTETVVVITSVLCWLTLWRCQGEMVPLFSMLKGLDIVFRIDGMGVIFAGLVSLLWPIANLYAIEYMQHEERRDSFFAFYTMTYSVALCVAFSGSLFTLYICYEFMTLITLPLVAHKHDAASSLAGRKSVYFSISGAAMALMAVVFVITYSDTNMFTLGGVLSAEKMSGMEDVLRWVFLLAFVGFGTKAAIFPMYAWLPAASVAPTPVTALLHAVAVVNTGAFAVLRVIYYSFGADFLYGSLPQMIAIGLACFTLVFGSAMAVKEQHFKRRLAYSTVSNLSYMLMGAALMTPAGMVGSLTHLMFHGVMKITLFYCAGAILVRTGYEYVQDLRGFHRVMPFTCGVFALGALAMVGIPPLCGFVSKWNLLTAAADTGLPMGLVAIGALIISAILTAIYLFTVAFNMYFRPLNPELASLEGTNRDPSWKMKVPFAVLCTAIVALGIWSQPLITYLRAVAAGL